MANNASINLLNSKKIGSNWLNNHLKAYLIRYHDFPTDRYISEFTKAFKKDFILILEKIILDGAISYFSLYTITKIFIYTQSVIWLGEKFWHAPLIILGLGLIVVSIRQIYEWKRNQMKSTSVTELKVKK